MLCQQKTYFLFLNRGSLQIPPGLLNSFCWCGKAGFHFSVVYNSSEYSKRRNSTFIKLEKCQNQPKFHLLNHSYYQVLWIWTLPVRCILFTLWISLPFAYSLFIVLGYRQEKEDFLYCFKTSFRLHNQVAQFIICWFPKTFNIHTCFLPFILSLYLMSITYFVKVSVYFFNIQTLASFWNWLDSWIRTAGIFFIFYNWITNLLSRYFLKSIFLIFIIALYLALIYSVWQWHFWQGEQNLFLWWTFFFERKYCSWLLFYQKMSKLIYCSSIFHALLCHSSPKVKKTICVFDYMGIYMIGMGSCLPGIFYGFSCYPFWRLITFFSIFITFFAHWLW